MTTPANDFLARCTTARVPVSALRAHPQNPRQDLGDLSELTEAIRAKGITQTVLVMPHPTIDGDYQILIGHRRIAAARAAGFDTVLANIAPADLSAAEQMEIMLIENLQRTDLKPSEEIAGVRALFDMGNTAQQVSKGIGKHISTVKRYKKASGASASAKEKLDAGQITLDRVLKIAEFADHPQLAEKLEEESTGYNFDYYYKQAQQQVEDETYADIAIASLKSFGVTIFEDGAAANEAGFTLALYPLSGELPKTPKAVAQSTKSQLAQLLPEGVTPADVAVIAREGATYIWRTKANSATGQVPTAPAKSPEQLESERIEAGLIKNLAAARKSFTEHILHRIEHPKTLNKNGASYGLALAMTGNATDMGDYGRLLGFDVEGSTFPQMCQDFFDKACAQSFDKLFAALVAVKLGVTNDGSVSARHIFELRAFNPATVDHGEALRAFTTAEQLFDWTATPAEKAALNYYQPTFDKMYINDEVNF